MLLPRTALSLNCLLQPWSFFLSCLSSLLSPSFLLSCCLSSLLPTFFLPFPFLHSLPPSSCPLLSLSPLLPYPAPTLPCPAFLQSTDHLQTGPGSKAGSSDKARSAGTSESREGEEAVTEGVKVSASETRMRQKKSLEEREYQL